MHPIGEWPSDPGHRALLPFSKPAATLSLPLASATRGPHSQTDNEHDASPIIESIRALTRAPSTTAADGQPRRARARSAPGAAGRVRRRRSSTASARHAVVSATTRSPCRLHGLSAASPRGPHEVRHARRPHTRQEETPRPAPPRRPQQARHDRTMGCPQWGESSAWRPAFRAKRVACAACGDARHG